MTLILGMANLLQGFFLQSVGLKRGFYWILFIDTLEIYANIFQARPDILENGKLFLPCEMMVMTGCHILIMLLVTYPTSTWRHSDNRLPRVGLWIVPLGTTQLGRVITTAHGVDHVVIHRHTEMFSTSSHRSDRIPTICTRIITLNWKRWILNK